MPEPRRAAAVVAVLLAMVCAVSGCATIPAGGPVRQGRDLAQEPDPQLPRSLGRDPAPGDGPDAIVRGFLQSGVDFLDDHRYAREYLAPTVRARWNPGTSTSIYDRSQGISVDVAPGSASATVTSTEIARIDADGRYHRVAEQTVRRTYGLSRVEGQWRINSLDNGLVLSSADVDTAYRQLNLYFLAPNATTLVPDPVLLPDLPGLTSKAITRLLQGPTAQLKGAVETAFPRGTRLEVASVPVRSGLATVRLDSTALGGDTAARLGMSAQIVWTLKQLRDIDRIRILAGGGDLVSSGNIAREQPRSAWASFDPDILASPAALYAVRDGRVGRLTGATFTPVRGAAGTARPDPAKGLRRPAVSLNGTHIAVTNAKGTALFVGRLASGAALEPVPLTPGTTVSAASWSPTNDLWFIDRTTNRLDRFSRADSRVTPVPLPNFNAGPLQLVRVSRDGTRLAFSAGVGATSRFFLGAIVRGPGDTVPSIAGVHEVLPDVHGIRDIAWLDADTLIIVGSRAGEPPVALRTDTDGLEVDDAIDPLAGIAAAAGAPTVSRLPLVAATDAGQLQEWDAGVGWKPLGPGRDPIYPG